MSFEIMDAAAVDPKANAGGYHAVEVPGAAPDGVPSKPALALGGAADRDRAISDAVAAHHESFASEDSVDHAHHDIHVDMLAALDAARGLALSRERAKEAKALKNAKYFAQEPEPEEGECAQGAMHAKNAPLGVH